MAFLALRVPFERREEIAADLSAIDLTRDLDAAAELMWFFEESVASALPALGLGVRRKPASLDLRPRAGEATRVVQVEVVRRGLAQQLQPTDRVGT